MTTSEVEKETLGVENRSFPELISGAYEPQRSRSVVFPWMMDHVKGGFLLWFHQIQGSLLV